MEQLAFERLVAHRRRAVEEGRGACWMQWQWEGRAVVLLQRFDLIATREKAGEGGGQGEDGLCFVT
jgi:hypothetical protein